MGTCLRKAYKYNLYGTDFKFNSYLASHVKEHAVYTHAPYMGMLPDIFYIKNEI